MTVSDSYTFSPSVDLILRMALQRAGLLPLGRNPSATELAHARDHMNTTAKSLSSRGAQLMHRERETLSLVAGTSTYVLAPDTIEAEFPMTIVVTGATGETWIQQLVWDTYQKLSNKEQQGTPTGCYVEKHATVSLVFWPVPDKAFTLSYRRQRLIRDMESGSTIDQTQRWFEYWVWEMAAQMAWVSSLKLDEKRELRRLADDAREKAEGRENEGGDLEWCLDNY